MNPATHRGSSLARRRLLAALGLTPQARRGRFAPPASRVASTAAASPIVLLDRPDAAANPLLRAIIAVLGVDSASIRVDGAPIPDGTRVLLAIGACKAAAAATAPGLDELARDPAAKRALWRTLRPLLRNA